MTQTYTPNDRDQEDQQPAPLNGYELVASVQVHPDDPSYGFIVVLDRNIPGLPERYVTGYVVKLTDAEWHNGHYFATYGRAISDLVARWRGHALCAGSVL